MSVLSVVEPSNGIITLYEPSSDICNVEYVTFNIPMYGYHGAEIVSLQFMAFKAIDSSHGLTLQLESYGCAISCQLSCLLLALCPLVIIRH